MYEKAVSSFLVWCVLGDGQVYEPLKNVVYSLHKIQRVRISDDGDWKELLIHGMAATSFRNQLLFYVGEKSAGNLLA